MKSPDRAEAGQVWQCIYTNRCVRLSVVDQRKQVAEGIPLPIDKVVRLDLVKGMVRGHRLLEGK